MRKSNTKQGNSYPYILNIQKIFFLSIPLIYIHIFFLKNFWKNDQKIFTKVRNNETFL